MSHKKRKECVKSVHWVQIGHEPPSDCPIRLKTLSSFNTNEMYHVLARAPVFPLGRCVCSLAVWKPPHLMRHLSCSTMVWSMKLSPVHLQDSRVNELSVRTLIIPFLFISSRPHLSSHSRVHFAEDFIDFAESSGRRRLQLQRLGCTCPLPPSPSPRSPVFGTGRRRSARLGSRARRHRPHRSSAPHSSLLPHASVDRRISLEQYLCVAFRGVG